MISLRKINAIIMMAMLPLSCYAGDHHHHHQQQAVSTVSVVNVPTMVCPTGYTLDSNRQCVSREEVAPERLCLNGGELMDDLNCIKTANPIMKCPIDYTLVGENMCQKNVEIDPIAVCPPGFSLTDGQMCTGSKTVAPIKKCLQGVLNEMQTECILQKSVSPISHCPSSDYTLVSNERCVREVLYDCTPATTAVQYVTTGHGHGHGHGHHHQTSYVVPQTVVSRTCSKTETVPAQMVCPEGAVKSLTGFGCLYTSTSEPTLGCANGSMVSNGECVEVVTIPAELECPNPAPKPSNEFFDGKYYSLRNSSSVKSIGYGSQYVYDQGSQNFNNPAGILTRRLGRRGVSHHHHHAAYYPTQTYVQQTYVQQPIPVIEEIPRKKCFETRTVPGELGCPAGYVDSGDKKGLCKSITPSSMNCPAGTTLNSNGVCIRNVVVQPTIASQQQEIIQTTITGGNNHHHHH
ncbi:oocyst wall protein 8 [Cryptosporidium canis]|uniref:Oocyst wall protein 8 n=1 Tax=Cryptosporidium canis TaxID=195482 RepID=A0ABQ8PB19_9CRYT|nr:oocyst wall protein 8 [Cryptosporidium canis]